MDIMKIVILKNLIFEHFELLTF